jgi:hypothetical protein
VFFDEFSGLRDASFFQVLHGKLLSASESLQATVKEVCVGVGLAYACAVQSVGRGEGPRAVVLEPFWSLPPMYSDGLGSVNACKRQGLSQV